MMKCPVIDIANKKVGDIDLDEFVLVRLIGLIFCHVPLIGS
jgi:hypothetical protein